MANVNKVILIGRLGNQPELKYTPSNRAVTELRLAVNRSWTDRGSGQRQEKTDWFSVEVWDKNAELGRGVHDHGAFVNLYFYAIYFKFNHVVLLSWIALALGSLTMTP